MGRAERGQSTVEWVGLLAVVALLFLALVAAGVRVPGASLARAIASKFSVRRRWPSAAATNPC